MCMITHYLSLFKLHNMSWITKKMVHIPSMPPMWTWACILSCMSLIFLICKIRAIMQECLTLLRPHGLSLSMEFPGKNTGVGCHFLLQGIFPIQGSNSSLTHCWQSLYRLSHQGSKNNNTHLQVAVKVTYICKYQHSMWHRVGAQCSTSSGFRDVIFSGSYTLPISWDRVIPHQHPTVKLKRGGWAIWESLNKDSRN